MRGRHYASGDMTSQNLFLSLFLGWLFAGCGGANRPATGTGGSSTAETGGISGASSAGVPGIGGSTSSLGGAPAAAGGSTTSPLGGEVSAGGANGGVSQGGKAEGTGAAHLGGGGSSGAGAGGTLTGGTHQGGSNSGSGGSSAGAPSAALTKDGEGVFTSSGLEVVSYGGYLNGESFQQDGIITHEGYQYAAFWNTNRRVVLARRALPTGEWQKFEFTDYANTESDAHNTISLGICPQDGTLHLAFDHHDSPLHYRRSSAGVVSEPTTETWDATSFGKVASSLGGVAVTSVTYPRFVTEPGGNKLLLSARIGASGSGDEYLWEYDAGTQAWTSIGKYVDGIRDNINAYLHGLTYTRGGSRLHAAWCWRETPDASTNHDLLYMYSDDHGRTWQNSAGAAVSGGNLVAHLRSTGLKAFTIAQNRGLINQEHLTVDALGRVHVLLSHMPDSAGDESNFETARGRSQFFHYYRDAAGAWRKNALGLNVIANFRGKLAVAASNNVYAILPDLRLAGASASAAYADWKLLDMQDSGRFFSDPLIDSARLENEDKLTVLFPQKRSPNIYALDYTLR